MRLSRFRSVASRTAQLCRILQICLIVSARPAAEGISSNSELTSSRLTFIAKFKELTCRELTQFIKHYNVEDSVLNWIRYDLDNRKSLLETILVHVRLPYCMNCCLLHMMDTYDLFTPTCYKYIIEATLCTTMPHSATHLPLTGAR